MGGVTDFLEGARTKDEVNPLFKSLAGAGMIELIHFQVGLNERVSRELKLRQKKTDDSLNLSIMLSGLIEEEVKFNQLPKRRRRKCVL